MGLFKDLKNIRDAGNERGGMPNLRDSFRDMAKIVDDRGERDILKSGVAAKAIVRGLVSQVPGDRMAMQIPLEIHPPQGEPYTIDYVFPTIRMRAALSPGMEVPVKIDPSDPQRVAVQWDAQKASIAAAGGSQAAVDAGMSRTYGGYAQAATAQAMQNLRDGTAGVAPPAGAVPDVETRMRQLDQLKAAGLIDDQQYQAKKQKLIDQL